MIEKRHIRMRIADLIPYEDNPRNHNRESIEDVKQSILQCGDGVPLDEIEIDENNVILAGHGRRLACLELGITEVDVTQYIGMTEEQKKKYRILANKTQERSTWDMQLLEKELDGLDFEGYDFGFDDLEELKEFEKDPTEVVEDEYDQEPPPDPISKRGDVWQMGDHRLVCGDSTDPNVLTELMDGEKADLWMTDPPYNVDYTSKEKDLIKYLQNKRVEQGQNTGIANDKMESGDFQTFLISAFRAAKDVMKAGACFYICHADTETVNFRTACKNTGLQIREVLVWVKNHFVIGHNDYQWKHEPIIYGWKEGQHYFTNSRGETTVIEDLAEIDPKKMKKEELVELVTKFLSDSAPTTVLRFDKPTRSEGHPTMKPVKLFDYLIRNSSKKGQIVLDTFAGSGTTIMACEQNGRQARCVELSPGYCDVIIRRYEAFTGKKAKLIKQAPPEAPEEATEEAATPGGVAVATAAAAPAAAS